MRKIYIATFLLCCMAFFSCGNRHSDSSTNKIRVDILELSDSMCLDGRSDNKPVRTYIGSIEESANASLNIPLGGQVTGVYVSEGDRVRQGQTLVCVDAADAEASLAAAQAQLGQAQDAYNRVKAVYDKGGVSEVKWVDVQTKLAQAQSVFDVARKSVSNRTLTAPFNGVVGEVNATVGDHLLPGQTAVKILNIDLLTVAFYVPELEIGKVGIGDTVDVDCPSLGTSFSAVIQEKALVASRVSHSYKVKARLTKAEQSLLPGMNCKIRVAETDMNGFIIPGHAVQTYQGGLCCWVVRDGKAQRVPIVSSAFVSNGVLISNGLKAGDKVIVSGYQKLYNGAEVDF